MNLLNVERLSKHYLVRDGKLFGARRRLKAVDEVSFQIEAGESLGLVGESGSGKSTVGRTLLRLTPASAGRVLWEGRDLLAMSTGEFRPLRRELQMIFQDPASSLNPAFSVEELIAEPLLVHRMLASAADRRERVRELLAQVGLDAAHCGRRPHELSGGQKQRVGIARALAVGPRLIVADEPVSALDVSVQSQVLNLMQDLKERHGHSMLFIAHDLAVVRHMSRRVAVMYLGRIVELALKEDLYRRPAHPYTQLLLASIPRVGVGRAGRGAAVSGEIPSPIDPPSGCPFRTRCPRAMARCAEERPALREVSTSHWAACHLV